MTTDFTTYIASPRKQALQKQMLSKHWRGIDHKWVASFYCCLQTGYSASSDLFFRLATRGCAWVCAGENSVSPVTRQPWTRNMCGCPSIGPASVRRCARGVRGARFWAWLVVIRCGMLGAQIITKHNMEFLVGVRGCGPRGFCAHRTDPSHDLLFTRVCLRTAK